MSDSVWPHRWQPTRLPHPWDSSGKKTGVGCHFLLQCMKVKSESEVAQLCLTPSDPMDWSLPRSPAPGILQARTLEWVAISFSNAGKWKVKVKSLSRVRLSDPMDRGAWCSQSVGSQRVGHDWATSLSLFIFMHWRRKWQPTPVLLPGESQGRRSLVGCRLWGHTESDTTEAT